MTKIEAQLNKMLNTNGKFSNTQGIKYAYDRNNKIFVKGNKMYVGGTTSAKDWQQNFTKLKTGAIRDMDRYKEAKKSIVGKSASGYTIGAQYGR